MKPDERTALSYWFPVIERVLPEGMYPKTTIVRAPDACHLVSLLDGETPDGYEVFKAELHSAAEAMGYPLFLRNDLTSAKHSDGPPCIVRTPDDLMQSLADILEFWAIHLWSIVGDDTWIVRELLPTTPRFYAFGGLPVVDEWRFMVRDGKVVDCFPYWPVEAVLDTAMDADRTKVSAEWVKQHIAEMSVMDPDTKAGLSAYSLAVCAELEGDFSVDWMLTDRGWVLIDMADADSSWTPAMEDAA